MSLSSVFRSGYQQLDYQELISSPVGALMGVSPSAVEALNQLGIKTVFDLGSSRFFSNARSVCDYGKIKDLSFKFGMVPSDWVDVGTSVEALDDLGSLEIDKLRDVDTALAATISAAFDVKTIKELAYWSPYHAANQIVRDFAGSTMSPEDLQSEELRPRLGEYPTERVYYDTLVMLQLPMNGERKKLDGPLSLAGLSVSVKAGEGKDGVPIPIKPKTKPMPAIGALLTYSQSWNAQGLTLGHLLHSLALAPGESTRIAMIDWSRKSSAGASESIAESDVLDNSTSHSRAVSEVQNSVAGEMQSGGSKSSSSGKSLGLGASAAGSVGASAPVGPATVSASKSGGVSGQYGKTSGKAESSSWSIGTRSVGASMSQNVNDRTEQHAASVRNRRASAIREVSQNEHEQISTRIVANYNHMHALTVQYFEVVQIYRVTVKFHKAQRCLMIPMDVIDFSDSGIIERFRDELMMSALSARALELLSPQGPTLAVSSKASLHELIERNKSPRPGAVLAGEDKGGSNVDKLTSVWEASELNRTSANLGFSIRRDGSDELYIPDNAVLIGISVEALAESIRLRTDTAIFGGNNSLELSFWTEPTASASMHGDIGKFNDYIELPNPIELRALTDISIQVHSSSRTSRTSMAGEGRDDGIPFLRFLVLHVRIDGRTIAIPKIAVTQSLMSNNFAVCAAFRNDRQNLQQELTAHLKANADYYSTAIYRNMDDATMFSLLNQYDWNDKPLAAQVEPRAFTVAGNYLVFMSPVDMDEPSGITLESQTSLVDTSVVGTPGHSAPSTDRVAAPGAPKAIPAAIQFDKQYLDVAKRFKGLPTSEQPTWQQLLTERHIIGPNALSDERLVPIPTTGVFAEAVLGRSNSAEKLDITRFWNWQDSPIPLAAPEIAAIQAGSRAQAENLMPGQLGAPGVTIVNPTQLPDPAGLAAVLGAVQNGNMFRDMSGLAGTQAAMTAAIQAAGQAGQQAGANATTGMTGAQTQATAMHAAQIQKDIKQMEIAGDLAKASVGVAPVGKDKVAGISGDGARINHGRDMDKRNFNQPASRIARDDKSSSNPNDDKWLMASSDPKLTYGASELIYANQGALGQTSANISKQLYDSQIQVDSSEESLQIVSLENIISISKKSKLWRKFEGGFFVEEKLISLNVHESNPIFRSHIHFDLNDSTSNDSKDNIELFVNFRNNDNSLQTNGELAQALLLELGNAKNKKKFEKLWKKSEKGEISREEYVLGPINGSLDGCERIEFDTRLLVLNEVEGGVLGENIRPIFEMGLTWEKYREKAMNSAHASGYFNDWDKYYKVVWEQKNPH